MSIKTQEKHMNRLAALRSQDLTYIYGEGDSGPNGAKREFLQTGKTFLRAMAKDLGLAESKVYDCPGGIAVPGDVTLMGMWGDGNGIDITIRGENDFLGPIRYRTIHSMKDYAGGENRWMSRNCLHDSYPNLLQIFMKLKEEAADGRAA